MPLSMLFCLVFLLSFRCLAVWRRCIVMACLLCCCFDGWEVAPVSKPNHTHMRPKTDKSEQHGVTFRICDQNKNCCRPLRTVKSVSGMETSLSTLVQFHLLVPPLAGTNATKQILNLPLARRRPPSKIREGGYSTLAKGFCRGSFLRPQYAFKTIDSEASIL